MTSVDQVGISRARSFTALAVDRAICAISIVTNSAGLRGENPTTIRTMPCAISLGVVVVRFKRRSTACRDRCSPRETAPGAGWECTCNRLRYRSLRRRLRVDHLQSPGCSRRGKLTALHSGRLGLRIVMAAISAVPPPCTPRQLGTCFERKDGAQMKGRAGPQRRTGSGPKRSRQAAVVFLSWIAAFTFSSSSGGISAYP
jgi:hypothetical protein